MITTAAHAINQGQAAPAPTPSPTRSTTSTSSTGRAPSGPWRRWSSWSPSGCRTGFGLDPVRDVQVLAPMYRTAVGIDALNERLQRAAQPRRRAGAERALPARRPPDPDPQRARAGADERLDLLPASATTPTRRRSSLETDDGGSLVVPYEETANLRLAYAISVHKAQGCEVPVVVCVCHRSHFAAALAAAPLHRDHPRQAHLRAGRRAGRAGDGGAPRRRRRPPLLAGGTTRRRRQLKPGARRAALSAAGPPEAFPSSPAWPPSPPRPPAGRAGC